MPASTSFFDMTHHGHHRIPDRGDQRSHDVYRSTDRRATNHVHDRPSGKKGKQKPSSPRRDRRRSTGLGKARSEGEAAEGSRRDRRDDRRDGNDRSLRQPAGPAVEQPDGTPRVNGHATISMHSKLASLDHQRDVLLQQKQAAEAAVAMALAQAEQHKQHKEVAEQYASGVQQRAEAMVQELQLQVDELRRRSQYYEQLSELRLAEVHHLRRREAMSFRTLVEQEVFRAVEASGDAELFPPTLMPVLAEVQSRLGAVALQRRRQRLQQPLSAPLGLHPEVHVWAGLSQLKLDRFFAACAQT